MIPDFIEFPKMPRFSREVIVTEKIDGTNASIHFTEDMELLVGSRTRWITPQDDNHGFAKWAHEQRAELEKLGPGTHFGEWWGSGIQRGYGLTKGHKIFSLFNSHRWADDEIRPLCCSVVPVLWNGLFDDTTAIMNCLESLKECGSIAASQAGSNFMRPEGIVIFHTAGNFGFKKTIEKDEVPKSMQ